MALPPTKIYAYISTPERTFARLKADGLLREGVEEADVVRAMRAVDESYRVPEDGLVGPNLTDLTAFALSSFLNETGRELARTPRYDPGGGGGPEEKSGEKQEPPRKRGSPAWELVTAGGGLVLGLAIPTGLYLGLLTVLGVRPNPALHTIHYVLGSALAVFTAVVISFVGESLIEDVVKFVLFGGGAFAIWAGKTTPASAIILGMAVGAFLPLLARLTWGRKRPLPDVESPPPAPPPDRSRG